MDYKKEYYSPRFGFPVSDWFRWFAWHPVQTVDRGFRWLVFVNKRRIQKHDYITGGTDWWFQYACKINVKGENIHG